MIFLKFIFTSFYFRIQVKLYSKFTAYFLAAKNAKEHKDKENYKFQIPNYKQIPNPKLQITNPSLGTEYNDYNGVRC